MICMKARGEEAELRPSYWRTCRALANKDRLRLFKAVVEHDGEYSVRDYARLLGLPEDVTSVYLRQMNARGLLGVTRAHIKVFYNLNRDRSLPQSVELQDALRKYVSGKLDKGWEDRLVRIFKGFTHFNRLALIVRLAKGEATLSELVLAAGTIVKSMYHHLRFLYAAGLVGSRSRYRAETLYRLLPQTHPVTCVLLRHVLDGVAGGETYYNPRMGKPDAASRAVLKKIRREENVTADNWKRPRGTGVAHRRLSSSAQKAHDEMA